MQYKITGLMAAAIIVTAGFSSLSVAADTEACDVVTANDVNTQFAPRVFKADNSGPKVTLPAKYAQVSDCTYVSKGASIRDMVVVGVTLRRAPSDETSTTMKMMKEGAVQLGATPVDVAGLGDGAYWIILGGGLLKKHDRQLNVIKGKRIWLIIDTNDPKLSDEEAIARLATIARAALKKI